MPRGKSWASISLARADLLVLQDAGLHRISDEKKQALLEKYRGYTHAGAEEIVRWISGEYQVTDEMVQTQ